VAAAWLLGWAALLAAATTLAVELYAGQEPSAGENETVESEERQLAERGRFLFGIYCVDCHGEDGRGNDEVARERGLELPDLTRLAAPHDGAFPSLEVYEIIDGRVELEGHKRRDMPVWGLAFQSRDQDAVRQDEVQGRIQQLIGYLRSIQAEAAAEAGRERDDDR
jgi:mono/diheme cytochrome c family protein